MPIGRILLKSISESKKVAALKTDGARLLYTWLIPHVDVNGCFSGDVEVIMGQVFTRLKKTGKEIESHLEDMRRVGLVVRYQTNGDTFIFLPSFEEKQPSINRNREAKPRIPLPTPEQVQTNSGPDQAEVSLKLNESKLNEGKVNVPAADKNRRGRTYRIKLNYDSRKWEGITEEDKKLWSETFAAIDVPSALKEILVYWVERPKNKRLNWGATIVNRLRWLQEGSKPSKTYASPKETAIIKERRVGTMSKAYEEAPTDEAKKHLPSIDEEYDRLMDSDPKFSDTRDEFRDKRFREIYAGIVYKPRL